MNDFWLEIGITAVLSALKQSIKNPVKRDSIRPAMLKIASTILALWGDDKTFLESLSAKTDYERSKL